jgi:glycine cleavage system transcriptional repressor
MDDERFASLAAVGDDRVGLVRDVTALLVEHGVSIRSIRSATLGVEFALLANFSGSANEIDAVEKGTAALQQRTGLSVLFHRSANTTPLPTANSLTHDVFVSAYDAVGIVSDVAATLAKHNVNIERLGGDRYPAPNQGVPLFTIVASVHIPGDANESAVRNDLELLRENKGWADAELHPHGHFDASTITGGPAFPPPSPWSSHD